MANELSPKLTYDGMALLVNALDGGTIEFTRIVIGSGVRSADDGEYVIDPKINIPLNNIEKHENFVALTGLYNNTEIPYGFYSYELGVYAQDENGNEVLYAYRYAVENVDYVPGLDSGSTVETMITVIVSVGAADNVKAVLVEASAYAAKEDFEAHCSETNPHGTTAYDVGLGNVENVAFVDHTPEFTEPTTLSNIASKETFGSILGKIKRLFTDYIAHKGATNPHKIDCSTIGAAASSHTHAASAITSGSIPIARGGTGAADAANARKNLGVNAIYATATITSAIINATSQNQNVTTTIAITAKSGYTPVAVCAWSIINDNTSGSKDHMFDLNNISFSSTQVSAHLVNRYAGSNHCKLSVTVLYLKNL